MEYGQPAWSTKEISRILQGTIMLTEEDLRGGFDLLDAVWATGMNAFDTAALYGGGTCERVLGQWMEARGVRDRCFIICKSAHHSGDRRRVTPFDITADMHDSLARQRTDYQDLHLLHRDDPDVEVGPIVEILNEHKAAGRIRAFGGSNWTPQRIEKANEYADKHSMDGFVASSPNFSLADEKEAPWEGCLSISGPSREADREWYLKHHMPLFTWSSLARGFFSGYLTRDNAESLREEIDGSSVASYWNEDNWKRLDRVHELSAEKGASVPQIALAWVLRQPGLDVYALVGARTAEEAKNNTAVFNLTLSNEEMAWLDLRANSR
ncbi:MAG: aldo/keto reductase [Candidatus Latescibacterota bacterium]|nr:aldo/keto reductase [Candidatus Latescibacterota bacterium]